MGRDLLRLGSMTRCGTRLRLAPRRPERILGDIGNQDRNTHCRLMQAQKAEGARTICHARICIVDQAKLAQVSAPAAVDMVGS